MAFHIDYEVVDNNLQGIGCETHLIQSCLDKRKCFQKNFKVKPIYSIYYFAVTFVIVNIYKRVHTYTSKRFYFVLH